MMGDDISLNLSLFVAQGREAATADFYAAAFGAVETNRYEMLRLMMIEMQIGALGIVICGSDPLREEAPAYEGPFSPRNPGAVSAIFQLTVADVRSVLSAALDAGGTMRDRLQADVNGRLIASLYDPAGHVWVLIERGEAVEDGDESNA